MRDLLHEEFSFDGEVLAMLYQQHLSASAWRPCDGMYGDCDGAERMNPGRFTINRTGMPEFHTPSKFLSKARELQGYVKQLQANPDLLLKMRVRFPKNPTASDRSEIFASDLRPIQGKSIMSFYTRLFGGVAIFRNVESQDPFAGYAPGSRTFPLDLTGDPLTIWILKTTTLPGSSPPPLEANKTVPSKTVVLYRQKTINLKMALCNLFRYRTNNT